MPSTCARYTLITPPCATATTRFPAWRAMSSSMRRDDLGLERLGVDAAHIGPPPFDRGLPALVLQLPQLLDRDVLVGVRVVLRDPVDDGRFEPRRRRERSRGLTGAAQRARDDRVDALGREPCGEAPRLLDATRASAPGRPGRRPHPRPMRTGSACRTSRSSTQLRASASGKPEQRRELGERGRGIADLDRRHPHRARRLQVDAEVIEEDGVGRARRRGARTRARRSAGRACGARRPRTRRRRRTDRAWSEGPFPAPRRPPCARRASCW